jgi:hypothetical protein
MNQNSYGAGASFFLKKFSMITLWPSAMTAVYAFVDSYGLLDSVINPITSISVPGSGRTRPSGI